MPKPLPRDPMKKLLRDHPGQPCPAGARYRTHLPVCTRWPVILAPLPVLKWGSPPAPLPFLRPRINDWRGRDLHTMRTWLSARCLCSMWAQWNLSSYLHFCPSRLPYFTDENWKGLVPCLGSHYLSAAEPEQECMSSNYEATAISRTPSSLKSHCVGDKSYQVLPKLSSSRVLINIQNENDFNLTVLNLTWTAAHQP